MKTELVKTREEKMKEFYNTLKTDIDLAYFADEDHESFDDLRDAIEDGNGFDIEIIYYSRAIEYLSANDPSLRDSLSLAGELGYEAENLTSEILASLLASENARTDFADLESEITDFFETLNEERDNEEETEEETDED